MIRTQVYLPDDLYLQIRLQAKQMGQPAAALIRKYLSFGASKSVAKETAGESLLRIAKHASKKGPKDLSTNHDHYLYEED